MWPVRMLFALLLPAAMITANAEERTARGTETETAATNCPGTGSCDNTEKVGDGHCHDENNSCNCNWDGGDCCGAKVSTGFCTHCMCLGPIENQDKSPTTSEVEGKKDAGADEGV